MTILKCPFCGYLKTRMVKWEVKTRQESHQEYALTCMNCGATGPNELSPKAAVEFWNRRREEYPGEASRQDQ